MEYSEVTPQKNKIIAINEVSTDNAVLIVDTCGVIVGSVVIENGKYCAVRGMSEHWWPPFDTLQALVEKMIKTGYKVTTNVVLQ